MTQPSGVLALWPYSLALGIEVFFKLQVDEENQEGGENNYAKSKG